MRWVFAGPGIDLGLGFEDLLTVVLAEVTDRIEIDPGVMSRIGLKILKGKGKEACCGGKALFLQMDKAAGDLNEPLVKPRLRLAPDGKPDLLQYFVRLVIELRVEAAEETGIMPFETGQFCITGQQCINLGRFVVHGRGFNPRTGPSII